jgi:hypothetical protein
VVGLDNTIFERRALTLVRDLHASTQPAAMDGRCLTLVFAGLLLTWEPRTDTVALRARHRPRGLRDRLDPLSAFAGWRAR